MLITTRTFRVFVSSTFEDLKAERDALQRDVFPKLRKLCEENGARFQAIDLRWSVRDEAALAQQTMEICLREIERCQQTGIKPNFIVLLGDCYGWRPLPHGSRPTNSPVRGLSRYSGGTALSSRSYQALISCRSAASTTRLQTLSNSCASIRAGSGRQP